MLNEDQETYTVSENVLEDHLLTTNGKIATLHWRNLKNATTLNRVNKVNVTNDGANQQPEPPGTIYREGHSVISVTFLFPNA